MASWRGPDGILVEVIVINDRQRFKISQTVNGRRYLIDYCGTIAQVAKHVDLADLVEVIPFPTQGTTCGRTSSHACAYAPESNA